MFDGGEYVLALHFCNCLFQLTSEQDFSWPLIINVWSKYTQWYKDERLCGRDNLAERMCVHFYYSGFVFGSQLFYVHFSHRSPGWQPGVSPLLKAIRVVAGKNLTFLALPYSYTYKV